LENERAREPLDLTIFAKPPGSRTRFSTSQKFTTWEWIGETLFDRILNRLIMRRLLGRINLRFKAYPFFDRTIKKLMAKEFDLIITENRPDFTRYLSRTGKTRVAFHLHNEYLSFPYREMAEGVAASHRVITVSRFIGDQLGEAFPGQRHKIVPLPNGIDAERFDKVRFPGARDSIRGKYGIKPEDFVLIYSGRLVPGKGPDRLIQALKLLNDLPQVKLLVVGATGYNDNSPSDFICSLKAACSGINDRVIFTGYVDYEGIPEYYCAADVAVLPFVFEEPFGLVVIEALSMELPVISTRSGGVPEIVAEGFGILLDRENLEVDIANAVRHLYRHPQQRIAMGKAGRTAVLTSFTQRHYYDNFARMVNAFAEGETLPSAALRGQPQPCLTS
jgi:glycosyltransferase involved in cell wall biosynthesis